MAARKSILDPELTELALTLLDNGYEPIPVKGKAPMWKGWQRRPITREAIEQNNWRPPGHTNTGIRTKYTPAIDIDIHDPKIAAAAAEAAVKVVGYNISERVGSKGALTVYRTDAPFKKMALSYKAADGDGKSERLVEILADGQQFVAYGIHPDTRKPYTWTWAGFGGEPLTLRQQDLPEMNYEQARAVLESIRDTLINAGYYEADTLVISDKNASRMVTSRSATAKGDEVTEEELRAALSYINPDCIGLKAPDDATLEAMDAWIAIICAIDHAPVSDPDYDGEQLACDWSAGDLWDGEPYAKYEEYGGDEHVLTTLDGKSPEGATVGTIFAHARRAGYKRRRTRGLFKAQKTGGVPDFHRTRNGGIAKTFANALVAVQHMGATPEQNEFNNRVVFRDPNLPWDERFGRIFDDDIARTIRVLLLSDFDIEFSKENVSEAVLTVAASNRFHPVREYLDGLEWDGELRLDTWLVKHLSADDTPCTRAVGRKTLLGAVARVMRPGCKFDTMLVLQGSQGIGKSTAIQILAGEGWYCDGLPGDLGKADAVQAIQGAWIVEVSELDGLSRSQVTTIKAFLSRQVDRARFPYERHTKDYSRQCVFIASTNEGAYLRDPTGARRFWPVSVKQIDLAGIAADRDQLWAEAVVAYQNDEDLILPAELWKDAALEQEERKAVDPWTDILRKYLDGQANSGPKEPLHKVHASSLLFSALDISKDRQTVNYSTRLRNIMEHELGWTYSLRVRVGGSVSTGYVRLEPTCPIKRRRRRRTKR